MANPSMPSAAHSDDDNGETLSLLLSRRSPSDENAEDSTDLLEVQEALTLRLKRLSDCIMSELQNSFSETTGSLASHWSALVESAKQLEFDVTSVPSGAVAPEGSARTTASPAIDHQAFSTPEGECHLNATAAILRCSKDEATVYTMGALRRSSSASAEGTSSISSLLGTRALLESVLEYYQAQQISQLQILAECLRLELTVDEGVDTKRLDDDSGSSSSSNAWIVLVVIPLLQRLDEAFRLNVGPAGAASVHRRRGLFRWLLSLASLPQVPFTREQFEPSRKLRGPVPQTLQDRMVMLDTNKIMILGDSDEDASFDVWFHSLVHHQLIFQERQRVEALEALVVLLYSRVDGGVTRSDYALIILAFQSCHSFFVDGLPLEMAPFALRLQCLASLICIESMGLWRMVTTTNSQTTTQEASLWVEHHPFLHDIVDRTMSFETEMNAILSLLERYGSEVTTQRGFSEQGVVAAIGVAMFAMGLLLTGAYSSLLASESYGSDTEAYWQTFQTVGLNLSLVANDSCFAFDSVYTILQRLIEEPSGRLAAMSPSYLHDFPYELRDFFNGVLSPGKTSLEEERELSGATLIYASIVRELVVGIILAFEDSFFSEHRPGAASNLKMLSNLTALTFCNSPTLCRAFWEVWHMSQPAATNVDVLPLCRFLKSTHHLASMALSPSPRAQLKSNDEVLDAVAPLMSFCSRLAYDSKSAELVLHEILPPALMRTVLEAISSRNPNVTVDQYSDILNSLAILAEAGQSSSARAAFRRAFETTRVASVGQISGARLLASIVSAFAYEDRVAFHVCTLLSVLLEDAPEKWVIDVVTALHGPWTLQPGEARPLFLGDCAKSSVTLIRSLVKRVPDVVFCDSFDEEAMKSFLGFIGRAVTACTSVLPESLASFLQPRGAFLARLSFAQICNVMNCIAEGLQATGRIAAAGSPVLMKAAEAIRGSLVSTLATNSGLGDSIWFFACSPVALILASRLADNLREGREVSGIKDVSGKVNDPLRSAMSLVVTPVLPEEYFRAATDFLIKIVLSESVIFDFEGVTSKGWIRHGDEEMLYETSLAALRLLNVWAQNVEDIVMNNDSDLSLLALSCHRLLRNRAAVPPPCRHIPKFSGVWSASGITHFNLLMHLLSDTTGLLPAAISTASFDVLFLALRHTHGLSAYDANDMVIVRKSCTSSVLRGVVDEASANALILSKSKEMSPRDCTKLSLALRCFRVVSLCIKVSPMNAGSLLGKDPKDTIASMCKVVTGTIDNLLHEEVDASDTVLVNQVRNACGCLDVIFALWEYACTRVADGMQSSAVESVAARMIIDTQIDLVTRLSALVFDSSRLLSGRAQNPARIMWQRLRNCFLSLCLELLTAEIHWTLESQPTLNPDHPVLLALQRALDQNLARFSRTMVRYLPLQSLVQHPERIKPLVGSFFDLTLLQLGRLFGMDVFSEANGYDLTQIGHHPQGVRDALISLSVLDSEIHRSRSWHFFSHVFSRLLKRWRVQLPSHPLVRSMSSASFAMENLHTLLLALRDNLTRLREFQVHMGLSYFSQQFVLCAGFSSRLLLVFSNIAEDVESVGFEVWEHCLRLTSDCTNMLAHIVASLQDVGGQRTLQDMLVSAAFLLSIEGRTTGVKGRDRVDESKISLASTCCAILSLLIRNGFTQEFRQCFCSCALLLARLSERPVGAHLSYSSKLYDVFVSYNVVSLILRHTVDKNEEESNSSYAAVLSSSMRFFTVIATVGDTRFVELVMDKSPSILARAGSMFSASLATENVPCRGYGLGNAPNATANENEFHELWTDALTLQAAMLVSASACSVSTRRHVATASISFMSYHQELILTCLQQCVLIPSTASHAHAYTIETLREAALILSIASELCARDVVGTFQRDGLEVYRVIASYSGPMLASIGSFLGSCAASRDLFKLLSMLESAGELSGDQFSNLSPVYRLFLANGFPTAKHEALRLSTFVSRSMNAVAEKEMGALSQFPDHWKPPEPSNKISDPRSLSALENSCRAAVTCNFAFQAEQAAADTLFFAARVMWATHPSSSSFVTFSEAETRSLDSMSLVKLGAVISFRSIRSEPERGTVKYGEVLQSDTIRRQWRVRVLGASHDGEEADDAAGAECLVSDFQLAGIEDTVARRCVLACSPAPDSSGDVEAATGASPTVGHLILALRWCQEAHAEIKAASSPAFPLMPLTVRRLAEVSSALLGTEISLHRLVGSHPGSHHHHSGASSAGMLAMQLRDLFADEEDAVHALLLVKSDAESAGATEAVGAATAALAGIRSVGGLKELLSDSAWDRVRVQLRPDLVRAARDELEAQQQQASPSPRHHRYPHRSPFSRGGGGGADGGFGTYAGRAGGGVDPASSSLGLGTIRTRSDSRSPFRGIGI